MKLTATTVTAVAGLRDRADAALKIYTDARTLLGDRHPATLALRDEVLAVTYEVDATIREAWCRSPLGPACPICTTDRRKATEARAAVTKD
jgi:hypothetical protein